MILIVRRPRPAGLRQPSAGPDSERPEWLSGDQHFHRIDAACCVVFMAEFFFRLSCAESKKFVWSTPLGRLRDIDSRFPARPSWPVLGESGTPGPVRSFPARMHQILQVPATVLPALARHGQVTGRDRREVDETDTALGQSMVTLLGALLGLSRSRALTSAPAPAPDVGRHDLSRSKHQHRLRPKRTNAVSSYPLALWWSFTTVVTGGFGDIHNPESAQRTNSHRNPDYHRDGAGRCFHRDTDIAVRRRTIRRTGKTPGRIESNRIDQLVRTALERRDPPPIRLDEA